MRDGLSDTFTDTYMRKLYDTQQQKAKLNTSFSRYSRDQVAVIVSKGWGEDGKVFSERIWKNYRNTLPSQLADSLLRSTIKGNSYAKVVNEFRQRYTDVKRKHIHRLVVSEMGHVAESATARAYEEEEVERYQYMATLESRTCPVCRRLDGKVFLLSKHLEGTNYPMIHPWCRCTTTAYFKDMPKSDARYDQEHGQNVRNMTYDEWLKATDSQSTINPTKTTFTDTDIRAAFAYKSSYSYKINEKLRKNLPLDNSDQKFIRDFDSLLDKLPVYKGEALNRSLVLDDESINIFSNVYNKYNDVKEKQYISSATNVYNKDDDVRIIIDANGLGKDFRHFNPDENEVIFKRGTNLYVKDFYYKGEKLFVEVIAHE